MAKAKSRKARRKRNGARKLVDQTRRKSSRGAAEQKFVEDVLTRGEAVEGSRAKLPPGATHRIVRKRSGGTRLVRARFSLR